MDQFYVNPFHFIAKEKDQYFVNTTGGQSIMLTEQQAKVMVENESLTRKEIESLFETSILKRLMEMKCFVPFKFNLEDRNSRTNGYFFELGWLKEYMELKEKKVYLLGAGALGTHIGWGLCSLGVKNFTILDYDEIEASNLNRQILYTSEDIGRSKIEVLKEKLLAINPECRIETVCKKVEDMDCLRNLFQEKPDLVVRGIDSPVEISHWVFSVCEEMGIPYISGGTIGTKSLYGPTFVPEVTPTHDTIIMNGRKMYGEQDYAKRLKGTGISSGFAISSVANEIIIDAVKILCGKGNLVKYGGIIKITDHFEKTAEKVKDETEERVKGSPKLVNFFLVASALAVGITALLNTNNTPIILVIYLLLASVVFCMWHTNEKQMFTNAVLMGAIVGCTNLIVTMFMGRVNLFSGTDFLGRLSAVSTTIFMFTLMICIHAMLFILIVGMENKIFKKVKIGSSL